MEDGRRHPVVHGWGAGFELLLNKLRRKAPVNPTTPEPAVVQPVDAAVDPLLDQFDGLLTRGVPDAYAIWRAAQEYLKRGDTKRAIKCQNLNYFLHNSHIPNGLRMAEGVRFGYGGIGVVIHEACEIRTGAVIGANVTLGGRTNSKVRVSDNGRRISVPCIEEYAYLATGSKILGGVVVGAFSIVGANSVVVNDVPPLSIVAGSPAVLKGQITLENCLKYKSMFTTLRSTPDQAYIKLIKGVMDRQLKKEG